jgi:hypothetical protein
MFWTMLDGVRQENGGGGVSQTELFSKFLDNLTTEAA